MFCWIRFGLCWIKIKKDLYMNRMEVSSMQDVFGGANGMDAFCAGLAVASSTVGLAALAGATVSTGGGAVVVAAIAGAVCAGYGVYQLFG
jgi:hydrogenase maturation factor HypE